MSKVLLIDDNPTITTLYGSSLRNAGHQVEVANDGEAGLAALTRTSPDVIILDLAMPKANGLEVLTAIRSNPVFTSTPVIVFSNTFTNDRLQQVWDHGATQVLSKASSTPKQIVEAVRSSLAAAGRSGQ
jgi:CheY-like chemotaxis protein